MKLFSCFYIAASHTAHAHYFSCIYIVICHIYIFFFLNMLPSVLLSLNLENRECCKAQWVKYTREYAIQKLSVIIKMDDWKQAESKQWQNWSPLVWSRRKVSVLQDNHLRVGSHDSSFKGHVKNLGFYIDAILSTVIDWLIDWTLITQEYV